MRSKKYPKHQRLEVFWVDIISDSNWHTASEVAAAKPEPVSTLGYFLSNHKKALKLAHSKTDDGSCDYTVIPWACITKIEEWEHGGSQHD